MSYTMEDFLREDNRERFLRLPPEKRRELIQGLPPEEQEEVLQALPPERRLAGLSPEQIRQYLDQLTAGGAARPRRRKKK